MLDHKKPDPRGVTVMIKISTLIVISALILGCEEGPTTDKESTTNKGSTTEQVPIADDCVDRSITPINIIFVKNNEIRVSPPNAPARPGDTLRFHLIGNPETRVTISGKESYAGSDWIEGEGMGRDFIEVPVDPKQEERIYGYNIVVDGIGTLDPEVTIKR